MCVDQLTIDVIDHLHFHLIPYMCVIYWEFSHNFWAKFGYIWTISILKLDKMGGLWTSYDDWWFLLDKSWFHSSPWVCVIILNFMLIVGFNWQKNWVNLGKIEQCWNIKLDLIDYDQRCVLNVVLILVCLDQFVMDSCMLFG